VRRWPERVRPSDALSDQLNRQWRLFGTDTTRNLKRRLSEPFRTLVALALGPQRLFNSTVVQHINHVHEVNDQTTHAVRETFDDLFQRTELLFDRLERLEWRAAAMVDDVHRYQEAFAASERRIADSVGAMRDEHAQLRTAIGVLRHETQQLSRAVARSETPGRATSAGPGAGAAGTTPPVASAETASVPEASRGAAPLGQTSDALSYRYVGFEDEFRGSADAVRAGLSAYVPLFAAATDVLDVGCGRGEFLSLLRDAGVRARGIDLNETMVEVCRERGLDAAAADALAYLAAQPDASLGGLFAAQVVEHLPPSYLTQLLETAYAKLRPGSIVVLETINPACWFAFFSSYIRDITHERPLHPDTLKYLLVATGFQQVEIRYSAPYPQHDKLQPVAGLPVDAANTLNANAEKLNQLMFTYLDYAAIGRK
jgi:O-antigen chain-terminating methyltransferase